MKEIISLIGIHLFFPLMLFAQLPITHVYLFDYEDKERFELYNTRLLTFDNEDGYNNQPAFIGGELFITQSHRLNGKIQTDIVSLDFKREWKSRMTRSGSSEYSPTACPDGEHFSVIRAFENGVQQLWKLPLDKKGYGESFFPQITNVGYHCWLNENEVAMFLVDEEQGHELVIGNIRTGDITHVSFNVGRCIKKSPKGNLIYVHKVGDSIWQIKSRNIDTDETFILSQTLPENEDFEILPDGRIITGYQGVLYRLEPDKGNEWSRIFSMDNIIGEKEITRIAIDNGKIALVCK